MTTNSNEREADQILSALGHVVSRRKPILALCLFGVLGLVFYYNQTTPPVYEANASVVFEEQRDPVPDDVSPKLSWELYLFNRIEEINSRAFAEDVVAALPREALARFPMPAKRPPGFDRMRYIGDLVDEGIMAFPLRNSNIVRIRVHLSDPQLSLLVASLSLSVLEERSSQVRNKGVANLRVFVDDQLARAAAQLSTSENELTRFKEAHGITSLQDDSREILKKMTEAEVLYNSTLAEREAAQKRLAAVRQNIAAQRKDLVPTVTSIAGSSTQILRDKLVGLEAQQAQLVLQKYPVDHPEVVRLRQEIEQTKKTLSDEAMKLAKSTNIGDPIPRIEKRLEEAVSLQIDVDGLEARGAALKQTVEDYRHWLSGLPEKEMELARLERKRDVNQKVYMNLLERREDIRIAEAKQIPGSRVIDRPLLPVTPIEPRKALNLAMGAVLGLILGFGSGFLLESRAGRLGSMVEFEQRSGWAVLALIPPVRGGPIRWRWLRDSSRSIPGKGAKSRSALVTLRDPESAAGESYNMLRTRLELLGMGQKFRTLLITSCNPRDGKSSTLSNLAASLGAAGRTTVVVDAEFRRPTLHAIFGVQRTPGLADLLLSRSNGGNGHRPDDDTRETSLLQETPHRGVSVLASGHQTPDPLRQVAWAAMREVLDDLKTKYEIILVDSAPPLLVHDTLMLCGMVDAVVVVVDARSYDPQRLVEAKLLLERAGANVVGAVLNKIDLPGKYAYTYRREGVRPTS
jgi:capsular exopolysaccharide synthesis family protein